MRTPPYREVQNVASLEDLERLDRPPRQVSFSLILSLFTSGCLVQFGSLLVSFVWLIFWLTGGYGYLEGTRALYGPTATVRGEVTSTEEWNLTINDREVWCFTFSYEVDGIKYSSDNFTTGSPPGRAPYGPSHLCPKRSRCRHHQ